MKQNKIGRVIINSREEREGSLQKFLNEVRQSSVLSIKEEVELAQKIKQGDQKAKEKLILGNLRFLVSIAKQYKSKNLFLADIIQAGSLGLIRAAEDFDETKGFKFISYAVWWIRQSILKSLAEDSEIIRLPLNVGNLSTKVKKAISLLEQKNNREPSLTEISEYLELEEEKIKRTKILIFSTDQTINEEEDTTMLDFFIKTEPTAEKEIEQKEITHKLNFVLDKLLTKQEKSIVISYLTQRLNFTEIAEKYNMSRQAISQKYLTAIRKLRNKKEKIKKFLDLDLEKAR